MVREATLHWLVHEVFTVSITCAGFMWWLMYLRATKLVYMFMKKMCIKVSWWVPNINFNMLLKIVFYIFQIKCICCISKFTKIKYELNTDFIFKLFCYISSMYKLQTLLGWSAPKRWKLLIIRKLNFCCCHF